MVRWARCRASSARRGAKGTIAQPVLWVLWGVLPAGRAGDTAKLLVFVGILVVVGYLSRLGLLPRTRPIVPGQLAISD